MYLGCVEGILVFTLKGSLSDSKPVILCPRKVQWKNPCVLSLKFLEVTEGNKTRWTLLLKRHFNAGKTIQTVSLVASFYRDLL